MKGDGIRSLTRGKSGRKATWQVNFRVNGKRYFETVSAATRKEAKEKRAQLLRAAEGGMDITSRGITLTELLDRWLNVVSTSLRQTTLDGYRCLIDTHIKPALGGVPVRKLSTAQLEEFLAEKARSGRLDGKSGGLSASTRRSMRTILNRALERARSWKLVEHNVMQDVDRAVVRGPQKGRTAWTQDEAQRFIASTASHRWHIVWIFSLATGLRRGEVCGLKWSDLDLDAEPLPTYRVKQARVVVKGGVTDSSPKSAAGHRMIAFPEELRSALHQLREKVLLHRSIFKDSYAPGDYVFCLEDGRPLQPSNLYRDFKKVCENAGVTVMCVHEVRHTFATLKQQSGADLRDISAELGHSNPSFTFRQYMHSQPESRIKGTAKYGAALFGNLNGADSVQKDEE